MAKKAKSRATKTAQKKTARKTGAKRRTSRINLRTAPLFAQAEALKKFAKSVLTRLEGDEEEREVLNAFITRIDDVQESINGACRALNGNPMFRSFTVRQ